MQKIKVSELPEIIELKKKIDDWRRNKATQKMPENLWKEVVAAGKQYGVSPISSFLKTDYAGLRRRILGKKGTVPPEIMQRKNFVELPPIAVTRAPGVEVELVHFTTLVRIRSTDSSIDWENLFTGWLRATGLESDRGIR